MDENNSNNNSISNLETSDKQEQGKQCFFKRMHLSLKITIAVVLVLLISIAIMFFVSYQQGSVDNYVPPKIEEMADQEQAEEDLSQIASALSTYYAQNFAYPSSLQELVPDFIDNLPVDPLAKKPYLYQAEGDSYVISVFDPKLYHCEYFYYEDGFLTKE
ncbi:MAG: hypothetical protein GX121_04690 [Ignavibacteria bacterium]|jgi:hypothetical protein|nr:hypothetical protein [Ignavibacteria bacterium]